MTGNVPIGIRTVEQSAASTKYDNVSEVCGVRIAERGCFFRSLPPSALTAIAAKARVKQHELLLTFLTATVAAPYGGSGRLLISVPHTLWMCHSTLVAG